MTKATKYKKEIKKVDYIHAKQYLESSGWNVVLFNTPNGNSLVDKLGLQEYTRRTDGFVYDVNYLRYVFINGQMSESDKLITLLHETGHIELKQDLAALDKLDELNAWQFAYDVLFHSRNVIKKIIAFVITIVLTASLIHICHVASNNISNTKDTVYVTQSGEHYHTSDCYFVQNKDTVSLKLKEAQKQYDACAYCNPNK